MRSETISSTSQRPQVSLTNSRHFDKRENVMLLVFPDAKNISEPGASVASQQAAETSSRKVFPSQAGVIR